MSEGEKILGVCVKRDMGVCVIATEDGRAFLVTSKSFPGKAFAVNVGDVVTLTAGEKNTASNLEQTNMVRRVFRGAPTGPLLNRRGLRLWRGAYNFPEPGTERERKLTVEPA